MEKNLFQQAKDAIIKMTNMQDNPSEGDQQAVKNAIESAYVNASPEEQRQLKELEQQLKQSNK